MVDLQTIGVLMTGVSVTVAAVYYIFTLRINMKTQQLALKSQELALKAQQQSQETRQAQLFMGIYQTFYSPAFAENEFILTQTEMKNMDDYHKMAKDSKVWTAFGIWYSYYEGIGVLVREGLVDIRLVAELMSGPVRWFWEKNRSMVLECREGLGWPRMMIEVEYLYNRLNEYAESHPELQVATPKY
jgi:hypothetical protein